MKKRILSLLLCLCMAAAMLPAVALAADTSEPTVTGVTPGGTDAPVSSNIAITFSEAMNTTATGTVYLSADGGTTYGSALTGGSWSAGDIVYTIPYSGLSYSTAYTVKIEGFQDAAGNTMATDSAHSFTTCIGSDFTVTGGTSGTVYTYQDNVLTFLESGNYTVSMASSDATTTTDKIVVNAPESSEENPVNITLQAVSIDLSDISDACAFEIWANSTVSLTLSGTNTLKSSGSKAGLYVDPSAALIIGGDGTLTATAGYDGLSNGSGAGIGGAGRAKAGSITINGGIITATGGSGAAGVGSTGNEKAGSIIINDGTVTANGGNGAAGIGGSSNGGSVIITGGTVTANGGNGAAGIGGGSSGNGGDVTIEGGTVTANGGPAGAGIGGGLCAEGGNITITGGEVTANGGSGVAGNGGAGIGGGGNYNTSLGGSGGNITITGGEVTATGGSSAAGIGGGSGGNGGDVTIEGGTVTANGSENAAGIGGGNGTYYSRGNGDSVTINGGEVTANGGENGAGIGGGYNGDGGNINITGGIITANGGNNAAGIGGGKWAGGVSVTITGGTVTANGGESGAGIGSGYGDSSSGSSYVSIGNAYISGGSVKASPGNGAEAIGKGHNFRGYIILKNFDAEDDVYLTTVTLSGISARTRVTSVKTSLGYGYGTTDMYTDENGKLYLYLPEGVRVMKVTTEQTTDGQEVPTLQEYVGPVTTTTDSATSQGTLSPVAEMPPMVLSVSPSGTGAPVSGNIVIMFSEAIATGAAGAVYLSDDGGTTYGPALTGGSWSAGDTVYTIPYSGLSYSTAYTVKIEGFEDVAGNTMTADSTHSFTTGVEPLVPSVLPGTLTVNKGSTASFTIAFGQGASMATSADITVANDTIASVSQTQVTTPGSVTVTGLAVGTTDITVVFNDTASTTATVSVTVQAVASTWPSGSSLTSSGVSSTAATLTWTAAQDVTAVTGYKLYQGGVEIATVAGDASSHTVTGLSPATSYMFQVQAGNADGQWTTNGPTVTVQTLSSGDDSSATPSGQTYTANLKADNEVATTLTVTVNTDTGSAAGDIDTQLGDTISEGGNVTITMPSIPGVSSYSFGVPVAYLTTPGGGSLTLNTDTGSITLPADMLADISGAEGKKAEITIGQGDKEALPDHVKAAIGDKPLIQLTLSIDGKQTDWSNPGAPVTVSIPYKPTPEELANPEHITVWYLDGSGRVFSMDGRYDSVSGTVIFSTTHFSSFAVVYDPIARLAGTDRVETALRIAQAAYRDKVSHVVLATAENYPDALAGGVLAYRLGAPILLAGSAEADQKKVIDYLKANLVPEGTVYILGGTTVVSSGMENKIQNSGFKHITRIAGETRYDTAVKIAEQLNVQTGTPVVLVSGENYPDALAVSSIAAQNQYPILLVQKDGIGEATSREIAALKPGKIYIIGLEGAISRAVESQAAKLSGLPAENIVRLGGADRYATSLAIAEYFNLGSQTMCLATGSNFPDALAGSIYAAKYKAPIILTDSTLPAQTADYVESRKPSGTVIFGGEAAVSGGIEQQIQQLLK